MDYTYVLVFIAFLVAVWNTSVGPTGNINFAAMAAILPPFAVIPIHAIVESVSGISRAVALRKFVSWRFVVPFVVGGSIGCIAGLPLLDSHLIAEETLQIILGSTMLVITWIPLHRLTTSGGSSIGVTGGFGTTFLTLFIGATGPLVSVLVHQRCPDQREMVGTWSTCMVFQHAVKILVFGLLGFSFLLYFDLLVALLVATILGTWIGQKALISIPQNVTRPLFKIVVTILAIYILGQGLGMDVLFRDLRNG